MLEVLASPRNIIDFDGRWITGHTAADEVFGLPGSAGHARPSQSRLNRGTRPNLERDASRFRDESFHSAAGTLARRATTPSSTQGTGSKE